MSIFYLLVLLGGMFITNVEGQKLPKTATPKDSYSVVLRNEVESIEVKEVTPSDVGLIVKLKLELLNTGSKPVILLQAKPPGLRGAALAKSPDDLLSFQNLVLEYHGESVDTSPEWAILRNALDQPLPPLDKVRVLQPNESWRWEDSVGIALPKQRVKNDFSDKRESWENIKQLPAVWLRVSCQVWPENLEPKSSGDRTENPFGHKLQKRWEDAGLLLLDGVQSEPIMLDLKTAVVR